MKKSEYYGENIAKLIEGAKLDLMELAHRVINKYGEGELSINFTEVGIGCPTYLCDPHDENLSHVINGVWLRADGEKLNVVFTVDDNVSGYDVGLDELDTDMIIYLLGEFEEVEI